MSLNPVVEQVVADKVNLNEMFTAHDVTLEVRTRGHKAGHNEVRDIVHDCYSRGLMGVGYGKTNISVPGGNPILYFPLSSDPNTYSNIRGQSNSTIQVPQTNNSTIQIPQSNSNILQPVTTNLVKNKARQQFNRCVDGRQTLSIPVNLVEQAGFQTGQKVHLTLANSNDAVEITGQPTAVSCKSYVVDRNQQIRITQSVLTFFGLSGKFYDIDLNQNKILVKLSK